MDHDLASSRAGQLDICSGDISLDFANTAGWHAGPSPDEYLETYRDLVAWALHTGLIDEREAARLLDTAARRPQAAEAAWRRAVDLREVLYRVFSNFAHGREPSPDDVTALNSFLSEALRHHGIAVEQRPEGGSGFGWVWNERADSLDALLWPVVRSAADLLTSPRMERLRECEGTPCGWLFLDKSRNRSRRWCSMEDCGNRAKARRHYARVCAGERAERTCCSSND